MVTLQVTKPKRGKPWLPREIISFQSQNVKQLCKNWFRKDYVSIFDTHLSQFWKRRLATLFRQHFTNGVQNGKIIVMATTSEIWSRRLAK